MISFRPLTNSERFLHRESIAYARATFPGSQVFQPSSARRTFCIALSRVKGGQGGRVVIAAVAMVLLLSQLTPLNRGRIASPDCRYKASHQCGDFIRSRIQGKVAGVEYVYFGFGNVLAIAFGFTEIEGQIVLTPDHQEPGLFLAHPRLPFWIRIYIRPIV